MRTGAAGNVSLSRVIFFQRTESPFRVSDRFHARQWAEPHYAGQQSHMRLKRMDLNKTRAQAACLHASYLIVLF